MFWCNFLTCVVILIIVRSVRYHSCEKTSNKQEKISTVGCVLVHVVCRLAETSDALLK